MRFADFGERLDEFAVVAGELAFVFNVELVDGDRVTPLGV